MRKLGMLLFFVSVSLILAIIQVSAAEQPKPVEATISPDGIQRAEIIVDSYSFAPDRILVVVGKPVELDLRSVTSVIPHNFSIHHPEAGMDINQKIPHGEDVKVTFTPTKTGSYEFYCNKRGLFGSHRKKGMEGTIEVKEQ
jgi:plastocyanin domain-containing protein